MNFSDIANQLPDTIRTLLDAHLSASISILEKDHFLVPILVLPDSNQLIKLQSQDGKPNFNKARLFVIEKLKSGDFV